MFSYQYYLDNTLYDGKDYPIKGIEEFEEVLERDYDKRGILLKYPSRLTFVNDPHDYIKTVRDNDTFCGNIEFKLLIGNETGSFIEYQKGIIYVSTSIFNLNECTVDCEIVDNSYYAKILNNYQCEAMLASNKSKNNVDITPCPYIEFKPFDPSTGGNLADSRYGVDVYDALKFLVQFMSDGEMTFQSDWFEATTPGTEWKDGIGNNGLLIINGDALRDTTGSSEKAEIWITFEKVFKDISKIINLWFYIRKNADGSLTMKAERYPEFQNDTVIANLRYSNDLELSFDNYQLYATVDVGSSTNNLNLSGTDYMGYVPSLTFRTETYNVAGQCNNASNLDLKTEFITDHNLITYQTLQATDDNNYDNYFYLIQYDNSMSNPHDCNKYNTFNNPSTGYYNRYLMNDWVLQMTDFHGELVKNNNPGNVLFSSYVSGNTETGDLVSQIIPFNNENYDYGNDFNTTTYKWTCPADGYYNFTLNFSLEVNAYYNCTDGTCQIKVPQYSYFLISVSPNIAQAFGIGAMNFFTGAKFSNTKFPQSISFGAFYNAGDIEWLDLTITNLTAYPPFYQLDYTIDDTTWSLNYSNNGGILKPDDRNKILINKFALKNNIEQDEWLTIRESASNAFQLYITNDNITKAWVKSIKRKVLTGNTDIELLTNNLNY